MMSFRAKMFTLELLKKREISKKGFSFFELVIALGIILIFLGFLALAFSRLTVQSREIVLLEELNGLRSSINLYHLIKNKYPHQLEDLVKETYLLPRHPARSFFTPLNIDEKTRILDPFGKPYQYFPDRGQVFCDQEKYRTW